MPGRLRSAPGSGRPLCWRRPRSRRLTADVGRGDPSLAGEVSLGRRLGGFVALTKPRIIELLLVTTLPTMIVAARGLPPLVADGGHPGRRHPGRRAGPTPSTWSSTGTSTPSCAAPGAGRWSPAWSRPAAALIFAVALEVVAFAELWAAVNLLSAVLAVSATLFYVFVYTLWLKRTSRQNIVIGGAAGAVPVLVGWAAVRGQRRAGRRSCCSP